jgi:hypothetical protein
MNGTACAEVKRNPDGPFRWAHLTTTGRCLCWLYQQPDFPEMLRFIVKDAGRDEMSAIALSISGHLPKTKPIKYCFGHCARRLLATPATFHKPSPIQNTPKPKRQSVITSVRSGLTHRYGTTINSRIRLPSKPPAASNTSSSSARLPPISKRRFASCQNIPVLTIDELAATSWANTILGFNDQTSGIPELLNRTGPRSGLHVVQNGALWKENPQTRKAQ